MPYAQAGFAQLNGLAKKAGWTVVSDSYDPTALTFQTQASKLASANPDGVMLWGAATPADAQLLKQIRAAGYKGPAAGDVRTPCRSSRRMPARPRTRSPRSRS